MNKKIALNQLRVGMFVTELDIPWFDSPFFTHTRAISSTTDIRKLHHAGVKQVVIDTQKGLDVIQEYSPENDVETNPNKEPDETTIEAKKVNLNQEVAIATKLKSQAQKVLSSVLEQINNDKPIVSESLDPLLNDTLDSVGRNEQALITLLHMKQRGDIAVSHSFSVMSLALALGKHLGYGPDELSDLGQAALMHDIGWSKLPQNLFSKGKAYTQAEQALVKQHIPLGMAIIEKCEGFSERCKKIIYQHHECNSGKGYPAQLQHAEIDPMAKLLAVVDTYDEMINGLADMPRMLPTLAIKKLYALASGDELDATLASQLIHLLGIYPISSAVQLNSGEKGIVSETSHQHPLLPTIEIHYDAKGKPLLSAIKLNLATQQEGDKKTIDKMIDPTQKSVDPASLMRQK
jgi:putative nucleotidyltransferase with HDIG domain